MEQDAPTTANEFELSEGGANHQKPQGDDHVMTTAQGHPSPTTRTG